MTSKLCATLMAALAIFWTTAVNIVITTTTTIKTTTTTTSVTKFAKYRTDMLKREMEDVINGIEKRQDRVGVLEET